MTAQGIWRQEPVGHCALEVAPIAGNINVRWTAHFYGVVPWQSVASHFLIATTFWVLVLAVRKLIEFGRYAAALLANKVECDDISKPLDARPYISRLSLYSGLIFLTCNIRNVLDNALYLRTDSTSSGLGFSRCVGYDLVCTYIRIN